MAGEENKAQRLNVMSLLFKNILSSSNLPFVMHIFAVLGAIVTRGTWSASESCAKKHLVVPHAVVTNSCMDTLAVLPLKARLMSLAM